MGAPPHGGFAMGIERSRIALVGEPDIRQVIAFPKVPSGSDPLTGAPTADAAPQLAELGVRRAVAGRLRSPPAKADEVDRRGSRFAFEVLFLVALAVGLTLARSARS